MQIIKSLDRKRALFGALLVIATLALYVQVLHHEFINGWDDNVYITENSHVISGLTLGNVVWSFTTLEPFYWHPLTWLSHMLDCQAFGLNSGAHHFVNVVLHAINAFLLFLLLTRGTGSTWRSLIAAALFAVHPLNVETVAWAAERKSLLCVLFSLLTIAAYGWYVQKLSVRRYLPIVGAFVLALMSKPMAVTVPVALLLIDYWPLHRIQEFGNFEAWKRLIIEKLPLFSVALAVSAITVLGEGRGGTMVPLSVLPLSTRVESALIFYVSYAGKILWPAKLSVFYPHPASVLGPSLPIGEVLSAAIILAGITALVVHFHGARFLAFGWCFFVLTMVPMIGIIQVGFQGLQDHFTYVPSIGLFIGLTWALGAVVHHYSIRPLVPALMSLMVIAGYSWKTASYLEYWQNGVKLFGHAREVERRPNPWLEQLYANALLSNGQVDEAFQHYQVSCALGPRNEFCHVRMADILFDRGYLARALEEYEVALMLTHNKEVALTCLIKSGQAWLRLGDYNAAQKFVNEAQRIDPPNSEASRLREEIFMKSRVN